MPRAARNFTYGDGAERHYFRAGQDVPDEIADDIPEHLILESVASKNPESLTREQLMVLAGLVDEDGNPATEADGEPLSEDDVREALAEFSTKRDLIEWAEEVLGLDNLGQTMTREALEERILEAVRSQSEDE